MRVAGEESHSPTPTLPRSSGGGLFCVYRLCRYDARACANENGADLAGAHRLVPTKKKTSVVKLNDCVCGVTHSSFLVIAVPGHSLAEATDCCMANSILAGSSVAEGHLPGLQIQVPISRLEPVHPMSPIQRYPARERFLGRICRRSEKPSHGTERWRGTMPRRGEAGAAKSEKSALLRPLPLPPTPSNRFRERGTPAHRSRRRIPSLLQDRPAIPRRLHW